MIDVTLLFNKSNPFGIAKDVEGIQRALAVGNYRVHLADPLEPPRKTDLAIHLEIPVNMWIPWATRNVLVVNPEWFVAEAWTPYMDRFDAVVYKNSLAAAAAVDAGYVKKEQVQILSWGLWPEALWPSVGAEEKPVAKGTKDTGFVWFLGGSKNKRAYVPRLVSLWKPSYPPLRIYSTEALDLSGVAVPENVRVEVKDLEPEVRIGLSKFFRGHVCCSQAEGFGYTAAEAEWAGAFTLLNTLQCYQMDYKGQAGVHFVDSAEQLDTAIAAFENTEDFDALAVKRVQAAQARWERFANGFRQVVKLVQATSVVPKGEIPPLLTPDQCPAISIVTLLYNRKRFFDLASYNMIVTDYPQKQIEWILVDDSDDPDEDASVEINKALEGSRQFKLVYVPLKGKRTVAAKRNIGVARATADIVLMMDDDDLYPETSFRRRVAWLTKGQGTEGQRTKGQGTKGYGTHQCVAATTIACYDLVKGISAVNVPPMDIPLGQRVSEATLTFWKAWWEKKQFPEDIQIGEGEGFVAGREAEVLEIPPQQVIVALSHNKNASSRRIPSGDDVKPGCFWGFPKELLVFLHGLAGVKVVAEEED